MDPASSPLPAVPGSLRQRAGDVERQVVCDQLAAHYAAGRLREDELDARLGAALAAGTLLDLRRLVADLPPSPAGPVLPTPVRVRVPWSAVDVAALLAVVGCLAVAVLAVGSLVAVGAIGFVAVGFLGGSVAALGGAALCHLLHAAARRAAIEAAEDRARQRPRIA
jgi:hypothetical protein